MHKMNRFDYALVAVFIGIILVDLFIVWLSTGM